MSEEAKEVFRARKKHKEMEDFLFHLKPDLKEDRERINQLYNLWHIFFEEEG